MMLHMGDKYHGTAFVARMPIAVAMVSLLEPEKSLKLDNSSCHAISCGKDDIVGTGVYVLFYFLVCLPVGKCHEFTGFAGLGMRIAHKRAYFFGEDILDWPIEPPACNPVGIDESLPSKWRMISLPVTNCLPAELFKIGFEVHDINAVSRTTTKISCLPCNFIKVVDNSICDDLFMAPDQADSFHR